MVPPQISSLQSTAYLRWHDAAKAGIVSQSRRRVSVLDDLLPAYLRKDMQSGKPRGVGCKLRSSCSQVKAVAWRKSARLSCSPPASCNSREHSLASTVVCITQSLQRGARSDRCCKFVIRCKNSKNWVCSEQLDQGNEDLTAVTVQWTASRALRDASLIDPKSRQSQCSKMASRTSSGKCAAAMSRQWMGRPTVTTAAALLFASSACSRSLHPACTLAA